MTSLRALSLLALLMPAQSQEKFPDYRLAALQIKDAKVFTAEELLAQFSIKPGDLVRIAEIKNGLEKIKAMYEDRGYINWSYVPEQAFDHPNKRMSLTFWLTEDVPHYVRRLGFHGDFLPQDDVKVYAAFKPVEEGGLFRPAGLDAAVERLNRLGLFQPVARGDCKVTLPRSGEVDISIPLRRR